jgi:hypothetical protein
MSLRGWSALAGIDRRTWARVSGAGLAIAGSLTFALVGVSAQRGGAPAAPLTARQAAPIDLTGTWVAIVTEDWRWRMVTPPKGDVSSVPVNAEGRKAAMAWDAAADAAAGNECRAFGVGGIMRQPGRVRISWQDPLTLKMEFDAGTQTRLLAFDRGAKPSAEKTWQGFSRAEWEGPGIGRGPEAPPGPGAGPAGPPVPGGGGQGLRGGPPPRSAASLQRGGSLKIVTTNFKAGYLRKNGVPYSEQATITEYVHRLPTHASGDDFLNVVTVIEDPRYLSQPFYTSTNFRRETDGTQFKPSPCRTDPPLRVKSTR